jgi:hypothetical protein
VSRYIYVLKAEVLGYRYGKCKLTCRVMSKSGKISKALYICKKQTLLSFCKQLYKVPFFSPPPRGRFTSIADMPLMYKGEQILVFEKDSNIKISALF